MCNGVVWCGVVHCGVVQCVVVWCGVMQCGVVWCSVVQCGVVQCSIRKSRGMQRNAEECSGDLWRLEGPPDLPAQPLHRQRLSSAVLPGKLEWWWW